MSQKPASKAQIKAINIILKKLGRFDDKGYMILHLTNCRTCHSSELYFDEASELLQFLNKLQADKKDDKPSKKMMGKLFAMAHEMGWVTVNVTDDWERGPNYVNVSREYDYSRLYDWVLKYGWKKKPLNDYTYDELPKLVSVFEFGPYRSWLKNPNR